jgi:hypothetical protein
VGAGDERKLVTILFADLVGSTAFADERDPERVRAHLQRLLDAASILERFALRALGVTRGDDDLRARADERFRAFGLDWHCAQTERLLAGIS